MRSKVWRARVIAPLAVVLFGLGVVIAWADSGSATYNYLLAPSVARASNGETVQVSADGTGTLSIHSESVTGGGTFTHRAADGSILGSGSWSALQLLSFNGYGCVEGIFCGGLAVIRVHLSPDKGGPGVDAILKINCAIDAVQPGNQEDWIRLAVQDGGPNFNEQVSSEGNVFILLS